MVEVSRFAQDRSTAIWRVAEGRRVCKRTMLLETETFLVSSQEGNWKSSQEISRPSRNLRRLQANKDGGDDVKIVGENVNVCPWTGDDTPQNQVIIMTCGVGFCWMNRL